MLHYKGDIMKKDPGKKADIVILKDVKMESEYMHNKTLKNSIVFRAVYVIRI